MIRPKLIPSAIFIFIRAYVSKPRVLSIHDCNIITNRENVFLNAFCTRSKERIFFDIAHKMGLKMAQRIMYFNKIPRKALQT